MPKGIKKTDVTVEPASEPVGVEIKKDNVGFSIVRNPENQYWMLLKINFDYKTGSLGSIEKIEENPERSEVIYRFKVLAGDHFMS